jgi:hypothetical protein
LSKSDNTLFNLSPSFRFSEIFPTKTQTKLLE